MTSIGRLRYKVALQKATDTADGGGGRSQVFNTIAELFADIRPTGGDETDRQGKVQPKTQYKIIIRHRADISTDYRISYDSRIFQIQNILNIDERDRFLELAVSEGVSH